MTDLREKNAAIRSVVEARQAIDKAAEERWPDEVVELGPAVTVSPDTSPLGSRKPPRPETGPGGDHYAGDVQPVQLIDSLGLGDAWDTACVIKYVSRAGRKGDAHGDLQKAKWHLERLIERAE